MTIQARIALVLHNRPGRHPVTIDNPPSGVHIRIGEGEQRTIIQLTATHATALADALIDAVEARERRAAATAARHLAQRQRRAQKAPDLHKC